MTYRSVATINPREGRTVTDEKQAMFGPSHIEEVDPVNHPRHYKGHPSGIECIQVTEHMGFCLGNAVKYIWRADLKGNADRGSGEGVLVSEPRDCTPKRRCGMTVRLSNLFLFSALLVIAALFWLRLDAWLAVYG